MPATTPKQKPFPEEASKNGDKNGNGYIRPTFVRCDLSADQKREMAIWSNERNADDLLSMVTESISDGYTVSFKTADVGYQASLTQSGGAQIGKKNTGMSLVTRATTPERALWSLYYKHVFILERDWTAASTADNLEW